jgi:hypothetical protein
MGYGEQSEISILILNKSIKTHLVEVEIVFHGSKIVPIEEKSEVVRFTLEIPAQQVATYTLPIRLHESCELFEVYEWTTSLIHKGKKIEFNNCKVRMSPIYSPRTHKEGKPLVLFFTNPNVTREEFLAW